MSDTAERPLFILERKLGCTWSNLHEAEKASEGATRDLLSLLDEKVPRFASEDSNLVVFGSLARREWTDYLSDLDWTYVIDGQAKSGHLKTAQQIRHTLV
jgi:predicted nucleotidyltransferase